MSVFFVTGAGTDIGKTYVACALLRGLRARGVACEALKPVVSGYDEANPAGDPIALLEALGVAANPEAIARVAPLRFRAPLAPPLAARAEGLSIHYEALEEFCRLRINLHEGVLLIEGAGGVMSPLTETRTFLDLIEALETPVVFVAGSYLGAVSHALTGLDVLAVRKIAVAAVIVSESEASAGLQDTRDLIQARRPDLAVLTALREEGGKTPDWVAAALRVLGIG